MSKEAKIKMFKIILQGTTRYTCEICMLVSQKKQIDIKDILRAVSEGINTADGRKSKNLYRK